MKILLILISLTFIASCNTGYYSRFNGYINPLIPSSDSILISETENDLLISFSKELINKASNLTDKLKKLKQDYPQIIISNGIKEKEIYIDNSIELIKEFSYKYYTTETLIYANDKDSYSIVIYYRTNIYTYVFKKQCLISFRFKKCNGNYEFIEVRNDNTYKH